MFEVTLCGLHRAIGERLQGAAQNLLTLRVHPKCAFAAPERQPNLAVTKAQPFQSTNQLGR